MGVAAASTLWHRLQHARSVLGSPRTLTLAPRWALRPEYLVLVADLSSGRKLPEPSDAGEPVRWTAVTDVEASLPRVVNPLLSVDEVARRRAEGQECDVAWLDGVPVHYRWECRRPTYLPYLHKVFRPLEGDILVGEAFTRDGFRGRGLHWISTLAGLRRAREQGLRRSISLVAWWNAPALHVVGRKAGRRLAGTAGCWHLGLAHRHFVTGGVRLTSDGVVYVAHDEPPAGVPHE
jgi:hypothetical protein